MTKFLLLGNVSKEKKRHRAVGIEGFPELPAMKEGSRAVLALHAAVGMAVAIARLGAMKGFEPSPISFLELSLGPWAHLGDSTPHRSGHWEVGVSALGEYLRGKTTLHSLEFVVLRIVILRFSASDHCLLLATGLCIPVGWVSPYQDRFHPLLPC